MNSALKPNRAVAPHPRPPSPPPRKPYPRPWGSETAQASVEAGATSATFKIDAPLTLPSDGSTQKVAILVTRLPATLRYETTPKQMEAAFLSASAVNGSDFPLLAGAVNTFLDDTFVAVGRLKTVMPGERCRSARMRRSP